ncbi:hypothetical protein [Microbacterium sp. SLBN-146]|uniref:hypothetical protein n=1 Tax=Microbacterium sp. SLBN-146 TaxID=2768457 RepID=UPI001150CE10|nr:hypothetical protein [Microbacterium sp. SLBN-146]TQJ32634.1 hypothetical protein FBY39_3148 [Microbacterium sp. SLBN-146]
MSAPDRKRDTDGRAIRLSAALAAITSSVLGLPLGLLAIDLLRDELHIQCSTIDMGGPGGSEWACSDGIGYIGFGLFLFVVWLATAIAGPIIAIRVRDGRDARRCLVALATVSAVWILAGTFGAAATLVDDELSPVKGPEFWIAAVGPLAILTSAAIASAIIALFLEGAAARVLLIAGALVIIVATVLQPGIGINVLPAAGLLAAAGIRSSIRLHRITGENSGHPLQT